MGGMLMGSGGAVGGCLMAVDGNGGAVGDV